MDLDDPNNGQIIPANGLSSLEDMPEEIVEIIRLESSPQFLDLLSTTAIEPALTLPLFTRYNSVFADTCARWVSRPGIQRNESIEAFARILPLAPHLSPYLQRYLETSAHRSEDVQTPKIQCLTGNNPILSHISPIQLQRILIATFRLLDFEKQTFSQTFSSVVIQSLFHHVDRPVRYLAVRIFCLLQSAADVKLEQLLEQHVGKQDAIMGDYDGVLRDYGFLRLFENERLSNAQDLLKKEGYTTGIAVLNLQGLSPLTAKYSDTLLPRPNGRPSRNSTLIPTPTTSENMEVVAKSLLTSSPVLLHGLAGSGKTSLVNDFARELGYHSDMVTLHLNEQTDAKMLIGMYASGSTPGSFTWRAGVLTTAVREGRWIFIEDLDRAPNEVISVILPLIERGELLIPSRGETIKAGPGFKLLASIRTSLSVTGNENPPALHMLGARLWHRVPVQIPSQDEFRAIIDGAHPILHQFLPGIISVYDRLYTLSHKPSFASRSRTSLGRPISPRDLLKWCRRLDNVLVAAGSKTGREPISEGTKYEMFLEAADCFAGSLQTEEARRVVISCIAEEMHIAPQRVEHFLTSHIPRYEDGERELVIGRARLSKRSAGRITKPGKKSRPFANTDHAKRLLEQVGVAVRMAEPVLLVGETGIGKTTVVQQLADSLGFKLTAVNLSQQSEIGDLLGGFKPVNIRSLAIPLKDEFDDLFAATGISASKNQRYVEQLGKAVAKSQWSKASRLWREAPKMFEMIIAKLGKSELTNGRDTPEQPTKRRKMESKLQSLLQLKPRWQRFSQNLDQFDVQLSGGSKGFAFTFIEGNIVKAARNGDWVLLDEINLASPDTLESIADLLHSGSGNTPSILLSETGDIERVRAHPNFRIFGAMNPATDVGKRDLPMGLRSRFTEIYVESPDRNFDDLLCVIKAYLKGTSSNDDRAARDVAKLYLDTKRRADEKQLVDGANQVPHFSLRTLTRVLSYVTEIAPSYGLRRSLYEGFAMGFLTLLNKESEQILIPLINHHLLESHGNPQALLAQTPRHPEDGRQYVPFTNKRRDRQYWMLQGSETPQHQPHYIITPFVERNMLNLVRATSTRRFPVLVQGPTSSGKTSMIEYLAKHSGNKFVRINNHEHTDLQEYLGTYVSGSDGQLRFQEGLLVQALRQGHWIVLDELNLAPTDVLEALNRLLDDNRELLIPETQEIVRPHENFMLFATQNPPGLYGGRKTLSRAFRNRFLELHFDDIPENELHIILEQRSQKVAPSDCQRIVSVYKELSRLRQSNRLFEQKDSFATLRDLFRWALRDADNREQLAANGYMLLGERVRNSEERLAVKKVIETVFKVKIDPTLLYDMTLSPEIKAYNSTPNTQGVVWTSAMRRLYILVAHALRNNEPVLLVGETGCGKTTVCQMLADAFGKELNIVNAHQNTETGDLIGAQRPVRNRAAILELLRQDLVSLLSGLGKDVSDSDLDLLTTYRQLSEPDLEKVPEELRQRIQSHQIKANALFEWSDGSLVQSMKEAEFFLLDEISLADDSVLERLNSVLESQRTLLLAEKGVEDSFIQAADGFQFFATMNPGGDYGKRELSPALRNRFTEIWVPSLSEHEDILLIVETKLSAKFKQFAEPMVRFAEWFGETYRSSASTSISVRDVLAWVTFINGCTSTDSFFAVLHGASMVYIDTLGANPAALLAINPETIREERAKCLLQLGLLLQHDVGAIYSMPVELINGDQQLSIGSFPISKQAGSDADPGFAFDAPTTKLNAMRVLRALQVQKPILIEGSPGVGKTTLVAALARACGKHLTRINLSEQTDLMDLFGSDVPVEGAEAGHFAWRDAPFLQAMQKGEWVLLDEMNLASQSVLEGLNACLDHRGEVYISELDQTFKRHPNFSVFAAQNPHHQGGGRKGLPASFVNRFTVVYADVFRNEDLELICRHNFPTVSDTVITTIINFVSRLEQDIVHKRRFGSQGGPWEFNLRDILRWLQLLGSSSSFLAAGTPPDFVNLIFRLRFRTPTDRQEVDKIFGQVFGNEVPFRHYFHNLSPHAYQVGMAYMTRDTLMQRLQFPAIDPIHRLPELESIMICVQQNLPCILVGPSGSGKTTMLEHVAAASGKSIVVFPLNADIDTMDLVGGFEQVDPQRAASAFLEELKKFVETRVLGSLPAEIPGDALEILSMLENKSQTSSAHFKELGARLRALEEATSLQDFGTLADACERFAATPMTLENARFEWVDGVLVKALEQGQWLVLDNANLCSASVLDRLNSLLEPNGFLSINEHCGPNGEPKIVRSNPEFRIFLTMDARFGELSRAMRNRAIEIFLEPLPSIAVHQHRALMPKTESSMRRYSSLSNVLQTDLIGLDQSLLVSEIGLDNIAWSDIPLLSRYVKATLPKDTSKLTVEFLALCQHYIQIYEAGENREFRAAAKGLLDEFGAKSGLPQGFRDAQILHPLQNSPLVPLVQQTSDPAQIYWLAVCFEIKLGISKALEAQGTQGLLLETIKPSKMNRLQRSLVSGRVPAVAKDSTVRVSNFLVSTLNELDLYLQKNVTADVDWRFQRNSLYSLLQFWWDTYNLATSPSYEEATFQAHLAIGTDLLASFSEAGVMMKQHSFIEAFSSSLKSYFDSGFKLTTGLSMELLWKHLRPIVVPKQEVMQTLMKMEQLALRFDALRWNTSISVQELGGIMTSLVKAYNLILTSSVDGYSLVETLNSELEKLEASIGSQDSNVKPFFTNQFEGLRQFKTLEAMRSPPNGLIREVSDIDIIILANHSTTSKFRMSSASKSSQLLQGIDYLWGPGHGLQPITTIFSEDLLHRLNAVSEVDMKSLKLLESELPMMGQKLATSTGSLGKVQLLSLNDTLSQLVMTVVNAHGIDGPDYLRSLANSLSNGVLGTSDLADLANNLTRVTLPNIPAHLASVLTSNFDVALTAIELARSDTLNRVQYSSLAWVQFAVGAITLYVPDRSFDPDERQRLERERHVAMSETLKNKLAAIRQYEQLFTGQSSNLRCQLLEQQISELGEPADILQEIYRPPTSEMDQLQGEFKNLLKTVVYSNPYQKLVEHFSNGNASSLQEITLMQNNVLQIIRRLTERFRAYSDLTVPVVNMLRCLQIGLSLAASGSDASSLKRDTRLALGKMTPFLGGGPAAVDENLISSQPLEFLGLMATASAIEPVSVFDPLLRQSLLKAFHGCFEQWSKRLESDRQDEESKSGLYRFKGSAEDEEEDDIEQFNELFPAYDDDQPVQEGGPHTSNTARDTAVSISNIHSSIFLGGATPSQSMLALIRQMSQKIGALHDDEPNLDQNNITSALIPGALLILDDQIQSLGSSATVPESYNFYTDANLPETRKLVTLIHQIQTRFRELQAVDEIGHMQPLEDVLVSCQELLQFRHTEPLAKIITKIEKVHTFMHEWQFGGWASRVNSALTLYDNVTSTIVNWRRLELSTWAKLFDMETTKCDDDAKSWWFVAYQVVIAAPLSNSKSIEELTSYAQKLLKDLEAYFSTAIVGQFVQRLQLLKQLQKHLEIILLEVPTMSVIHNALTNFIGLYARYEKPVKDNLKTGRVTLERAMRDVLLLASWKDTNIVALRDSAKRSHHKLFKVVRKFRSLLGQSMEFVLKGGLPDETLLASKHSHYTPPVLFPTVDLSALALCSEVVPKWSEKSKRFINVSKTVSMMSDASQVPESAVEGAAYLDSFLANIITSTAELQKATPSILTEENKITVKHLKSRKRKLFADTLKDLRQMGIKYNLGVNALSKQDSLSIVLTNVQPLTPIRDFDSQSLEYYFHKAVDLAPRTRRAAQQHSEDLSSAEVARSAGFLEGLLQVVLSQRNTLSVAISSMTELDNAFMIVKGLWAPNAHQIRNESCISSHRNFLNWLPTILSVSLELVKTHAKLGRLDNTPAQTFIINWMTTFEGFSKDWSSLPKLPSHIVSDKSLDLESSINESIADFSSELDLFSRERPELSFILDQIIPWLDFKLSAVNGNPPPQTISALNQKLSTVCDTVLVAIEKYKNSMKEMPTSTEEPNWLVQNDTCVSAGINSLHCQTIYTQIKEAFEILRGLKLDDEQTSKAAGALFAVALPILQQYFNIMQEVVTRYAQLHRATCKTSYILAKTFTQIASQGFCTPSEKQDAQDGKTEKLEGGTGLGEGEGMEDISKDIQDDENLDELAQEPDTGNKEEMEDEKDAVDMADADMEGEMQDGEEKGSDEEGSGDEEDGEDIDEEAGDVDDLDPNAIDEKMWDGDGEQAEKDQEGDDSKGKHSKDEQVAAQENDEKAPEGGEDGEEEEEEEEVGAEQGEEVTQQDEVEKHDPHAQEGDALDLPEDMELDGDEEEGSEGSDNGIDDLSDVEDIKEGDEAENDGKDDLQGENVDPQEDQNMEDEMDIVDLDEESEEEGEKTEEAGEKTEDSAEEQQLEEEEGILQARDDEAKADIDNAVPSDVQGIGEDQDDNPTGDKNESNTKAQREDGGEGGDSSEQKEAAAEDGEKGRQANGDAPQDSNDETQDSADAQPFKKLGDALESWHRQQTQIREAPESKEQDQDQNMDMNAESTEFQHLQDEEAEADAQAMGTATEEQAHTLDESMAVDPESNELPDQFQPDDAEEKEAEHDDVMDLEDPSTPREANQSDAYEGRAGATINQAKQDRDEDLDEPQSCGQEDLEEEVEEVDRELEHTHLSNPEDFDFRSATDARLQWTHYEAQTRDLSLSLTEQLRLILAPTLATKMRGDFRTGKRLNIKRIIPYIASQYKRDKIWMRRSVPSKRSYQIMLAVDDSKSMGESGSGSLAFETLVMVSKSLSMLEVGEICVVGFGEDVRVAHDFDTPFSSDAGPKVFQNFGFEQKRTDVTKLVRESIELFRTARAKASSSPSDLWQMELIISDGVCDSSEHEPIRRLLREALEERIMMVFVIVDDVKNKKKGESVMDLKEAKFVKDEMTGASNVKIERYLDTFPFQYYLIVSDVKELPGVLATLLRQWFAEVVDSVN